MKEILKQRMRIILTAYLWVIILTALMAAVFITGKIFVVLPIFTDFENNQVTRQLFYALHGFLSLAFAITLFCIIYKGQKDRHPKNNLANNGNES